MFKNQCKNKENKIQSKFSCTKYGSTEPWMSNFGAVGLLFNPSYHGNADTIKIYFRLSDFRYFIQYISPYLFILCIFIDKKYNVKMTD